MATDITKDDVVRFLGYLSSESIQWEYEEDIHTAGDDPEMLDRLLKKTLSHRMYRIFTGEDLIEAPLLINLTSWERAMAKYALSSPR